MNIIENFPEEKMRIIKILESADMGSIQDIELISEDIPQNISLPDKEKNSDQFIDFFGKQAIIEHQYGKNSGKIPLEEESEGTRRFFGFSGLLFHGLRGF